MASQRSTLEQGSSSKREQWLQNMRTKYPDIENEDELYGASMSGYDEEHDYAKRSRDEAQQLSDIVNQTPEIASFFDKASQGKIGEAFLDLSDLYKAYMNGEITDEAFTTEQTKRKNAETEKKAKIAAQNEVFVKWCEQKGYDPEEWWKRAAEQLFNPMSRYELAEAQFDAIDNLLNYDEDVEAARVQGRNENIAARRRKNVGVTDGQVNGSSVAAVPQSNQNKSDLDIVAEQRAARRNL